MMKVLLISPTQSSNFYQSKVRAAPPFGLYRLKKWIEKYADFEIKVDILNTTIKDYLKHDFSPYDIIGVSCLHPTLENDLGILHLAKKQNPKAILIAGGVEATFNSETIFKYSPVDYVVKGEGEKPMLDIVKTSQLKVDRHDLNDEEYRQACLDVDFGEMEWEKCWDLNRKNFGDRENYIRIPVDVNYCPRKCIFCSSTNLYNKLKYLSAKDLVEIIAKASKLRPDVVLFQSDNFLIGQGRERLFKLANELNFSFSIPLMIQTGVPDIDEKVIAAFKKIGVKKVSLGVESFSSNILKEFKKKQSEKAAHNVLRILLESGINVFANTILTSPLATLKDVEYTIKHIKNYLKQGVEFGINLVPLKLPGSELYNFDIGIHIPEIVEIPHSNGLKLEKSSKVYPNNTELREKILSIEADLASVKAPTEVLSKLILDYF